MIKMECSHLSCQPCFYRSLQHSFGRRGKRVDSELSAHMLHRKLGSQQMVDVRLTLICATATDYGPTLMEAPKLSFMEKVQRVAEQLDLVGLILLGLSVSLILLPLTLSEGTGRGWSHCKLQCLSCLCPRHGHLFSVYDLNACNRRHTPYRVWDLGPPIRITSCNNACVREKSECRHRQSHRML